MYLCSIITALYSWSGDASENKLKRLKLICECKAKFDKASYYSFVVRNNQQIQARTSFTLAAIECLSM